MTDDPETLADQIAAALAASNQIAPVFAGVSPPPLDAAYAIAARVRSRQGGRRVGLKVGFTNRGIWPVYQVDRPIWGVVYTETLLAPDQPVNAARFSLPRIEPEIVLGLARAPERGMSLAECADCIDWVAPGFEIVQSIYADWKFSVADAVAAQSMHGGLVLGEKRAATPETLAELNREKVALMKEGQSIETGFGANALDGPLSVLHHLVALLPETDALEAGELVTTGTLTDAWPIAAGETWAARYEGVLNSTLSVTFA
ncbi:MAG: 2-keto-4-pentenoate hydratase [Arenibacterium sp.]